MSEDEMTERDWRGVQHLMFVVEDQLGKADDVNATLEQMISRAATMIPPGPNREEFERHFRILVRPLVELELKRRKENQP